MTPALQALLSEALALHQGQDWDGAAERYDTVLRAIPDHPQARRLRDRLTVQIATAFFQQGQARARAGDDEGAWACFDQARQQNPHDAEAHYNCAIALARLTRRHDALACVDSAIAVSSDFADALTLRGNLLMQLGRPTEALASYDRAIMAAPDGVDGYNNRASALRELGRDAEAIRQYNAVIQRWPDFAPAHWNRAVARLLAGKFAAGWTGYEWRHRLEGGERPLGPAARQWRGGGDVAGRTILVGAEQGFGDSLQFSRYLPLLRDRGATVVFAVQAPLRPLLARSIPEITLIDEGAVPDSVDLFSPLLSLPLAFATRLGSIPPIPRLITPEARRAAGWQRRLGPRRRPRIGIAWSGNPRHANDHHRSIPLAMLRDLMTVEAEWLSVQKDLRPTDAPALAQTTALRHVGEALADFEDTAALIAQLDLVIAVDTSSAHLAALMGKPVWLLLAATPDWRWLRKRSDSPWYPTARLFRQTRLGDWRTPIAEVINALRSSL